MQIVLIWFAIVTVVSATILVFSMAKVASEADERMEMLLGMEPAGNDKEEFYEHGKENRRQARIQQHE